MPPVDINYLAVLVSSVASMAIGFAWYSTGAFGKKWMNMVGLSQKDLEKQKKDMGPKYGLVFLGSLVMAYVLSHFVDFTLATTIAEGMQAGFWAWLGFVATVGLSTFVFEGKPFKLYLINNGYQLVSLLVMGAILAVWV